MLRSRSLDGAADVHRLKMGVIDIMNVQVTVIIWINKLLFKGPLFLSYSMAQLFFGDSDLASWSYMQSFFIFGRVEMYWPKSGANGSVLTG